MTFFARFFWILLPIVFLTGFVRETGFSVARAWSLSSNVNEAFDTYKDMQGIANLVAVYYKSTQKLPPDLGEFLEEWRSEQAGRGRGVDEDAWGSAYRLVDKGQTYELVSCGPDRDCEIETDNLVERLRKVSGPPKPTSGEGGHAVQEQLKEAHKALKALEQAQ